MFHCKIYGFDADTNEYNFLGSTTLTGRDIAAIKAAGLNEDGYYKQFFVAPSYFGEEQNGFIVKN